MKATVKQKKDKKPVKRKLGIKTKKRGCYFMDYEKYVPEAEAIPSCEPSVREREKRRRGKMKRGG